MKETSVIIQLADRLVVYLKEALEDILAKVNQLIFPVDFHIINIEDYSLTSSSNILLRRPFLSTVSIKIDVQNGTFNMEFDCEIIKFNVYEVMTHPSKVLNVSSVDIIEPLTQECIDFYDIYEFKIWFIGVLVVTLLTNLRNI